MQGEDTMPELTRKYRERGEQAAGDFERGYHYAQNTLLRLKIQPEELKGLADIYRGYNYPHALGMAKACEEAAQKTVIPS
jgi:hypothetical protein